MSTKVKIELSAKAQAFISESGEIPRRALEYAAEAMDYENELTVAHIQRDYLSFPRTGPSTPIGCRVQTNRLRSSLRASPAVITGEVINSAIGSNMAYAAAQEFGATIPAHKVTAKGGALRFKIGERVIFAKSVNIPEITLPARGFVQGGLADRAPSYTRAISDAFVRAFAESP